MAEAPYILAVNAGSSSLKISLFKRTEGQSEPVALVLTGTISSITAPPAKFAFKTEDSSSNSVKDQAVDSIRDHASGFAYFLDYLERETEVGKANIAHITHRVVHGGDYSDPVIISDQTFHHIERLSDLAPLHNGAALAVIKACITELPNADSIAFFDTAFHRTIPHHIASYAIDQSVALKKGLKKYGFHGLSYAFISRSVALFLQKPLNDLNLIVLHLGSGASVCAVKNGKSLDTSMGLTPLNGLPGATRSGAIDPSLIFHFTNKASKITHDPTLATQLHVTQAEKILNSKSGWKSLTGTTDFGIITQKAFQGSEVDKLAFDLFADRILNYIGSYHLKLDAQVDAIVFAGGIGERGKELRRVISEKIACLGYPAVDDSKNDHVVESDGVVVEIGKPGGHKLLVCHTDEQFEMARQCALLDKSFWNDS